MILMIVLKQTQKPETAIISLSLFRATSILVLHSVIKYINIYEHVVFANIIYII